MKQYRPANAIRVYAIRCDRVPSPARVPALMAEVFMLMSAQVRMSSTPATSALAWAAAFSR